MFFLFLAVVFDDSKEVPILILLQFLIGIVGVLGSVGYSRRCLLLTLLLLLRLPLYPLLLPLRRFPCLRLRPCPRCLLLLTLLLLLRLPLYQPVAVSSYLPTIFFDHGTIEVARGHDESIFHNESYRR